MSSASVVTGEAAESDVEESSEESSNSTSTLHGAVVAGEASESDEEHAPSMASSVTTHFQPVNPTSTREYNSLLHKKLFECNISLYNNVFGLVRSTIKNSLTQLSSIDQQLLKSQLRLQSASSALKNFEYTSNILAERLKNATCSSYIPKVTIPIEEVDSE